MHRSVCTTTCPPLTNSPRGKLCAVPRRNSAEAFDLISHAVRAKGTLDNHGG